MEVGSVSVVGWWVGGFGRHRLRRVEDSACQHECDTDRARVRVRYPIPLHLSIGCLALTLSACEHELERDVPGHALPQGHRGAHVGDEAPLGLHHLVRLRLRLRPGLRLRLRLRLRGLGLERP